MSIINANNRKKGASVVEFAFVLPLLLVLVFGIIEFGIILFDKAVLTNACREGARAGIVVGPARLTDAEITARIESYCQNYLITFGSAINPVITFPNPPAQKTFGNDLTVKVTYDYDFLLLPGFIPGVPNLLTLEAQTVMRYE